MILLLGARKKYESIATYLENSNETFFAVEAEKDQTNSIEKHLGEEPNKDILQNQTDKMFFVINEEIVCRMCDLGKRKEKKDE